MSIGENIHNYYEKMVSDELNRRFQEAAADLDYLADVACVALNHLPPRYFRHEIDMAFYLSPTEFEEMREKVRNAVAEAIEYVDQSHRESEREDTRVTVSTAPLVATDYDIDTAESS